MTVASTGKRRTRIREADRAVETKKNRHWRGEFLAALADTSNVSAAAAAGVHPSRPYKVRREDPAFAGQWRAALCAGYDNLEMELLGHLRNPDPARKMDVANGLRLLIHHRQTVARERAQEDNRSEQEVLDSIDAFIDRMRENAVANARLLAEPDGAVHDAG